MLQYFEILIAEEFASLSVGIVSCSGDVGNGGDSSTERRAKSEM